MSKNRGYHRNKTFFIDLHLLPGIHLISHFLRTLVIADDPGSDPY